MKLRPFLVASMVLWPCLVSAAIDHDAQGWAVFVAQGKSTPTLRWFAEVQPRFVLSSPKFERLLVRVAAGAQLTPSFSLWLGYGWTPLIQPTFGDEQRPFLQALFEHPLGKVTLVNRTRLEARVIQGAAGTSVRLRHLLRALWRFPGESGLGLAGSVELFVTFNDLVPGPVGGFDQGRGFVGLNWKTGAWQFELGYLANPVHRREPQSWRLGHVALLGVTFTAP